MLSRTLVIFFLSGCFGMCMYMENPGNSWVVFLRNVRNNLIKCRSITKSTALECFEESSLKSFDEIMSNDVIPLTNNIRLIRSSKHRPRNILSNRFDFLVKKYELNSWQKRILSKFSKVLSTHILQMDTKGSTPQLEGKGRHRRRSQFLPAMMFGITALGMVLVPIGFQFLAVVAGKAMLMAKLALILASITGLKKITSSGINFGLYQLPEHYSHYDRDDLVPQRYP